MTAVSSILKNHRSIRHFTSEKVEDSILHDILECAHRAPSSSNLQALSLIVVKEARTKVKVAEFAGGQKWIETSPVFICLCIDYHKTKIATELGGGKQIVEDTLEGLISGCLDIGIALGNLMAAAQAHHLGVVPIGGIRNNMQGMAKILNLPQNIAPIVGLCIGHIEKDAKLKPRLPLTSFVHTESYVTKQLQQDIQSYNNDLEDHWKSLGRESGENWSNGLVKNQQKIAKRHMLEDLKVLGFFKDGIK